MAESPPADQRVLAVLRASGVFGSLQEDVLQDLGRFLHLHTIPGGDIVYREGDAADTMFFLISGRLRVSRRDSQGKLLLFNAHGGQASLLDIVARELRMRHDLIVYGCNWWNLPLGETVEGLFSAEEHRFGIHAGAIETSLIQALAPHSVRADQARVFRSTSQDRAARYAVLGNGRSAKLGWAMQDYNPAGAAGDATAASPAKGEAVLAAAATQLARLLGEISDLPLDTVRSSRG